MDVRVVASTVCAVVMLVGLAVLSFMIGGEKTEVGLNLVVLMLAVAAGWIGGILVTPYDEWQRQQFSRFAAAASAFVSGYGLAKLDGVISELLDNLFDPLVGFRVASFIAATLVTVVAVSAIRWYANRAESPDDE